MCGIAGLIWKGGVTSDIGSEMTQMLQALKHRGPDSTGFALYGKGEEGVYVLRFKVAEQEDMKTGFDIHRLVIERKAAVDTRMAELGAEVIEREDATEYAFRYHFKFDGDLKRLIDFIEDLDGVEILSVGKALELIKDLGDATVVSDQYGLKGFVG
ncbi:MAG: glutamine amidotransferase, partial [Gammaproteobacteria bacterium]|nr:glutamine amidotransferase [Gammaproteobacteria bacterium]